MLRTMSTERLFGAVLVTCGIALASCGGGAAPTSAPPPSPAASKPAASAAASAKPVASAAVASASAAASSGSTIKVGILLPLTGPLAQVGNDSQDGHNLYFQAINNTAAGRKIEPMFVDTQGRADLALTKAKQLVESDKVSLLMGVNGTPECYALGPYVKEAQVPLIVSTNCGAQSLTTDPKYASPYLSRVTQTSLGQNDPVGDWMYKKGYRKIAVLAADFGGSLEALDAAAGTFIKRGGQIVQEQYPALGTSDYGPFVAQLNTQVDAIATVFFGADALRFYQAYSNYAGQRKPQIVDLSAGITAGPNRSQLGDKVLGIISSYPYSTAFDSPQNAAYIKAYKQKYPDRYVAKDSANSYAGAMVLEAAIKKVNGNVEDKQKFLEAIYATNIETNKGPVKLDNHHDVVQNVYMFEMLKNGSSLDEHLLETYKDVPAIGLDRTPEEAAKFPIGQMKGKWVGMTKEQLAKLTS